MNHIQIISLLKASEQYAILLNNTDKNHKHNETFDMFKSMGDMWIGENSLRDIIIDIYGNIFPPTTLENNLKHAKYLFRYFLPGSVSGTYCMQVRCL
jgi:hypothetical protein